MGIPSAAPYPLTSPLPHALRTGVGKTFTKSGDLQHYQHGGLIQFTPPFPHTLQTGAGKTFTMSGDLRHYQHRGLIPQAIHHVFREIDMRVDKMYTVHVSVPGMCEGGEQLGAGCTGMVHALHMRETRSAVWGSIWESFLISVGQKVGFGSSGLEGRAT